MIRHLFFTLVVFIAFPVAVLAQDLPAYPQSAWQPNLNWATSVAPMPKPSVVTDGDDSKFNAFIGYSYLRLKSDDTFGGGIKQQGANLNGWQGSATYFFSEYFGATADIAGNYGDVRITAPSISGPVFADLSTRLHTFHFGPTGRYSRGKATIFARGLLGVAKINGDIGDDTSFSGAFGGGVDWALNKRFAIRLAQLDYVFTRFRSPGQRTQDGIRFSTGLVIR